MLLPAPLAARWEALLAGLARIAEVHPDALLASSMGVEDTLLIHAVAQLPRPLGVFMLDTGRLHAETLGMVDVVHARYGIAVRVMRPDPDAVRAHVTAHGEFAFYDSIELRQACCGIRKVEPLRRALAGRSAWVTGQRREQSLTRVELPETQWDDAFGLQKFNPLAFWTADQVWAVVRALDVPYNPLHDRGYPSIGCEPCTRAVRPGEDPRAGRWWWEQRDSRECGLHAGNLRVAGAPAVHPRAFISTDTTETPTP
ncbi:MAG: phosphoadenylyl-sulfate reductase [Castellaniella sp.]|uniref:phosphoadenylyl-sulfate reductase n=1 Tax=Castellaniella sp. TaxID=1955812 RepID=UPI002A35E375|nr:phosphoadenylyl-sulfate reductase [Castellaniella sp.]MDY0308279.1 phosphoadenylyl-sulfate reductase [Castellaniella sp.]